MSSRPAPGVQDTVQHRGRRTASHHGQDAAVEHDRAADERPLQAKHRAKPIQLDGPPTPASEPPARSLPAGKPALFFSTAADNDMESSESSLAAAPLPLPPRPSLPMPADVLQHRRLFPGGSGVKPDPALIKSTTPDTPSSAALLPGGRAADLFPWTGSHAEDVLSEALVKGGINNKSQIMNETNTARPSLWANLKNKSGTSTLSTLFVAVLEKRQACNRLTAPNTFKPPPRLTLRDSTREAWLHDLANPAVGLRRLSRTIPHGITGKVLLDQCLNKSIPIPRALWLAKCVGINEMRAHKRKGQAGTNTWVRGWTSSVEQFLDGVIAAMGQQDWKNRITYALQLATHLFKDHLVEEDHFIDWILKSLQSSSSERLFLWLLITCIPDFWASLISSRRHGKRFAESLLAHAEKLYTLLGGDGRETSVLGLLESVMARMTMTKPACLLLPDEWEKRKEVLHVFVQRRRHAKVSLMVTNLDRRNGDLMHSQSFGLSDIQTSSRLLYRLLDNVEYDVPGFVENLAFECLELIPGQNRLVSAVLDWSSSLYRQGVHRVYLATRLLRKWNQIGIDVSEGIMAYLPLMDSDPSKESKHVFKVITELVRSKTFPLGKYLQWLIASGSMGPVRTLQVMSAWQLRILVEIPLTGLSEQVSNLRSTMLRGTSYSVDTEEILISRIEDSILQLLANGSDTEVASNVQMITETDHLSQTVLLEVAMWLRLQVASTVETTDRSRVKNDGASSTSVCTLSPFHFKTIRCYLERFNDLAILADVVGIAATSYDAHVLSASADTLCYHSRAFKVMGAFDAILDKIVVGYTTIRATRIPERDLLLSVSALSQTMHVDSQIMQLLDFDLSRYDQKNSFAVCSPVSDTMTENATRSDPEEEIERILSTGNSMDHQMMNRLFVKIMSYLEERMCQGSQPIENLASWFSRLQTFEENTFHALLASWLDSVLSGHEEHVLDAVLPPLVVSRSLTLSRFLETVEDCMRRRSNYPAESFRIAVKGLDRILPSEELSERLHSPYAYPFRTQQTTFCQKQDRILSKFIQEVLELSTVVPQSRSNDRFSLILSNGRLLSALRHAAIVDVQRVSFLFKICSSETTPNTHIKSLLDRIIDPFDALQLSKLSFEQQATTIFQHADQLSSPFCQLKLRDLFKSVPAAGQTLGSLPAIFISFFKSTPELDHSYMLSLVSGLDANIARLIRDYAEEEILTSSAFLCDMSWDEKHSNSLDNLAFVRRLLDVICATQKDDIGEAQTSLVVPLVERLKGFAELITRMSIRSTKCDGAARVENDLFVAKLCSWLDVLLRLSVFQSPSLLSKANHQHQAAFMWNLKSLLNNPHLEAFPSTTRYIFDVAVLHSDSIAEDVRKSLICLTHTKCSIDTRCIFIFGADPQYEGWLGLMKSTNHPAGLQRASSPQRHPQAPNSSHSHIHGQQQASTPANLSQRSSNQQQQAQVQTPAHGRTFAYAQHQQSHKMLTQQLQRMGSSGPNSAGSQLQQMQQMQAMAQQRQMSTGGGSLQRMSSIQSQASTVTRNSSVRQEKVEAKVVPYGFNGWEILPENGSSVGGNETAINLNLFGARKA